MWISFLNKQQTDSGLSKTPPDLDGTTDGESKACRDGSSLIKGVGHVSARAGAQDLCKSTERLLSPRLLG